MPDPVHKPPKKNRPLVVPIKRAKRLYHQEPPAVEPPSEMMGLWTKGVSESNLAVIQEAHLRSEIDIGDPCQVVLRKARYALENVSDAFSDPSARKELVLAMVGVIKDYGEIRKSGKASHRP
jgi:hypothetical protein